MPKEDFFAFCTSLKPIELKAIGALSRVEHLAAAETIYRTGEPGDRLYILNRGVVEIAEDASKANCGTYLSRGDIFGELEVFTGEPRRRTARTCEPVSLQCFHATDFPELLARVPTFFRFLCDQLAARLAAAEVTVTAAKIDCLELSGSLANFDLVTIYQTIVNSSQTGELTIRNEAGEVTSTFYFDAGQPRSGTFDHLTGEEAFWQLFLAEDPGGSFSFASGAASRPPSDAPQLTRPPGDLLIHALQGRDEFQTVKRDLPDRSAFLERQKPHLATEELCAPALQPLIEQVWRFADKRRITLRSLYPRFDVCELKIYRAVLALLRSGHFSLSSSEVTDVADKVA